MNCYSDAADLFVEYLSFLFIVFLLTCTFARCRSALCHPAVPRMAVVPSVTDVRNRSREFRLTLVTIQLVAAFMLQGKALLIRTLALVVL
jgi:hypothetical protein